MNQYLVLESRNLNAANKRRFMVFVFCFIYMCPGSQWHVQKHVATIIAEHVSVSHFIIMELHYKCENFHMVKSGNLGKTDNNLFWSN